ncbi:TMV resistance protein N-like [Eucalyptus grandis]|uniref:TMV resistance protein N-like n=1 Tax=Eucalyptus grandis TaxID=71139 RepID=UPI00192EBC04|nr:TMV resistance protein N-like [Eucalyptus grandis]
MAISEAGSSSDAALASRGEYDVFLNFRGEDTRYGFTDFLYHSLNDARVHMYRDEEELPVSEVISEKLKQAIENTIIYIPIFSQTYASSKWCLRELALMVDNVSKLEGRKRILPIFFHVEPDNVKLKKTLYEADFKKHEEDFRDEVEAWKGALRKVLGIYGMGGIGKTTIAKVVFNQLCSQFGKCCSFLESIRERSTKEGLVQLQNKLLYDIVGSESVRKVEDSEEGMKRIEEILSNKKVLVVLDNVDKKDYIKKLIGNSKLYPGSRIIITTRDTTILQVEGFEFKIQQYEMLKMDDVLALRLFCWHAFGRDFPFHDYRELLSKIVSLLGGLPLAIEVLGSLLKETNEEEFWEETLVRLREAPEEAILEKLRISYDNLDKYQQQIFLDIACFFFNEKKTDAMYMWVDCLFYPKRGIEVLTTRCMIKILEDETFWMHDQLIDLGRQIVIQESPNALRKRSRLWIAKEALEVIKTKEYLVVDNLLHIIAKFNFQRKDKVEALIWMDRITLWVDNMHLDHLVVFKLDASGFTDDSKAWNLIKMLGFREVDSYSLLRAKENRKVYWTSTVIN